MTRRYLLAAALLLPGSAAAGPMIPAGDVALRHDIQLLADYGIIQATTTTWPMAWGPVLDDLRAYAGDAHLRPAIAGAISRVRSKGNWQTRTNELTFRARASLSDEAVRLRSFADVPREESEIAAGISWIGERFSVELNGQALKDPSDHEEFRADGSMLAIALGNWTVSANTLDRWWGPGNDGSLILSNNARPIPSISLDRNFTDAFASGWLGWVGPWDMSVLFGQMESDRAVPEARFFGFRFEFRPHPSLHIGLSRTAQWCGEGRPCDAGTFWDLLIGEDNPGDDGVTAESDPSNQTAAVDFRWSASGLDLPLALYGQFMGEDEAGGFPSRYLGQLGLEGHGYMADRWSVKWYVEAAATNCEFWKSEDNWNCAYNHSIYTTGYRYRGRVIGHTVDNDSRVATAGLVFIDDDQSWHGLLRYGHLNRGGAPDPNNSLTPDRQEILTVDLIHHRITRLGRFEFGVGFDQVDEAGNGRSSNDARGFIQWRSDY